jgi:UDP-glucose 4-epimerase
LIDLRDSTVLVTGGCGFIGHHLVQRLKQSGPARLIVVDDLSTGEASSVVGDGVELIEADFATGDESVRKAVEQTDYLFHIAAVKHRTTLKEPDRCLDVNVKGTKRLFEWAARSSVKKIVFSSSLYAHGRWTAPPLSEEDIPLPNTIYGISKLAGERLLDWFHKECGRPYVALRYFFAYGPGQYRGQGYPSVIYKNFERLLRGEAPVIFGDGEQSLDYIYIDDLVEATVSAMTSDLGPETLHIGSGVGVSVNQLTSVMQDLAGGPSPEFGPADPTHGSSRVAHTDKAQRLLNFKAQTPLKEGLSRTLQWLRERAQHGS